MQPKTAQARLAPLRLLIEAVKARQAARGRIVVNTDRVVREESTSLEDALG
jgi:hypothetical protein